MKQTTKSGHEFSIGDTIMGGDLTRNYMTSLKNDQLKKWRRCEIIHSALFCLFIIQLKICAKYRDLLPRPRLVFQEPGLRPIGWSPGVHDKSSRGLGSMSRCSSQILICFIAYIFLFLFLCGFGWELSRTASMHSALCYCPLSSEWGWSSDNQSSHHALLKCSWLIKTLSGICATDWWNWQITWMKSISMTVFSTRTKWMGSLLHICE